MPFDFLFTVNCFHFTNHLKYELFSEIAKFFAHTELTLLKIIWSCWFNLPCETDIVHYYVCTSVNESLSLCGIVDKNPVRKLSWIPVRKLSVNNAYNRLVVLPGCKLVSVKLESGNTTLFGYSLNEGTKQWIWSCVACLP
jgi:hypothetical protein